MIYLLVRLDQPAPGLTDDSKTLIGYSSSIDDVSWAASESDKKAAQYAGWNGQYYPKFTVQELQALQPTPRPANPPPQPTRMSDLDQSDEQDYDPEEEEVVWPF